MRHTDTNRSHTRRTAGARRCRRVALVLVQACAAWLATPGNARADLVASLERGEIAGRLTVSDGKDLLITPQEGDPVRLQLEDIDRITFGKQMVSLDGDMLVVNADSGQRNDATNKSVRLRAGLHRFVIPYWQGEGASKLAVSVSGPGINAPESIDNGHMVCFRSSSMEHEPSGGIDEDGFRLPELALENKDNRRLMQTRCRYRLYADDDNGTARFQNVGVLNDIPLKHAGTSTEVSTGIVSNPQTRFGLVFEGFFVATQDGEYTFGVQCDDGAQLYLGEAQKFVVDALGATPINAPWNFTLHHGGSARGELKQITDSQVTLHIPLVSDATLATTQIQSMWAAGVNLDRIDRDKIEPGLDTVYVRDKDEPTKLVAIGGKMLGLDDRSLSFEFRGKARTIGRERIGGIVLDHADRPAPTDPGFYQIAELRGGQRLPCRFQSLDEHAHFELIGGSKLTAPRDVLVALRCENGRRVDLTRLTPTAEEAIPYFATPIPSRVNRSFDDEPIRLFDGNEYERGLAVHSKSRLHYKLQRPAQTFKARFGLMDPGGRLGEVTARVIGDKKVLWEQQNITAKTKPIDLTVPLEGVQRLVLEVDFGAGQNVGDRAAWCQPQLIYAANPADQAP